MKLKDLTARHVVVVATQSEYDTVNAIFETMYTPFALDGFTPPQVQGNVNVLTLTNDMEGYTDGRCSPVKNGYLPVIAADFIAANTTPIPDHTTPDYGC